MERFNNGKIEKAFGDSLRNPYSFFHTDNEELGELILDEANMLHNYLGSNEFIKVSTTGIKVDTKKKILLFQSSTFKFNKETGLSCKISISTPINFAGETRLWTEDFSANKVWTTIVRIYDSDCNPEMLFDFLGKYTNRFSVEDFNADLLPLFS